MWIDCFDFFPKNWSDTWKCIAKKCPEYTRRKGIRSWIPGLGGWRVWSDSRSELLVRRGGGFRHTHAQGLDFLGAAAIAGGVQPGGQAGGADGNGGDLVGDGEQWQPGCAGPAGGGVMLL